MVQIFCRRLKIELGIVRRKSGILPRFPEIHPSFTICFINPFIIIFCWGFYFKKIIIIHQMQLYKFEPQQKILIKGLMKQIVKLGWISVNRGRIPLFMRTIPSSILSRLQKIWTNNNRNYESVWLSGIFHLYLSQRWILVNLFVFIYY